MLSHNKIKPVVFDKDYQPTLCIVIDTEEEFDWAKPHSREATATLATSEQYRAQEIFAKYDAIPTYVMDYCILSQSSSATIMKDMYDQGICEIGTHLHPWINPPHDEEVNAFNSLHGNLPIELERAKIKELTSVFKGIFNRHPLVFKAGRYGVGPNSGKLLKEAGYKIDCSVVPNLNMKNENGPSFLDLPDTPYWFGEELDMLEVSLTKGFYGNFRKLAKPFRKMLISEFGEKMMLRGICSKLGLFDLATLTPEGLGLDDLIPLLKTQVADGHKIISLTYHSSTLKINGSPYVTCEDDRVAFLNTIDRILDVFTNEIGGRIVPILNLYDELKEK